MRRRRLQASVMPLMLLTVALVPGAANGQDIEPNDDFATAVALLLPANLDGCIDPATDLDFFTFSIPEGTALSANATSPSGQPFRLDLFDARQTLVASATGALGVSGAPGGAYFLRVSADAAGCYRLGVSAEALPPPPPPPPPVDRFEPNDDFATATPLGRPPFSAQPCIDPASDVDFYAFDAAEGSRVEALAADLSGSAQSVRLALYDGRQQLLAEGETRIEVAAVPRGRYFLRVSARAAACYDVRLSWTYPAFDPFEPNDSFETATTLFALPAEVHGATIEPAGDFDFYFFSLPEGSRFSVRLTESVEGEIGFGLFLAPGVVLESGHAADPGTFVLDLSGFPAGTYYLRVEGFSGATGPYELSITGPPPDPFEPNDDLASATPITPNVLLEVQAALTFGDLDFFRFAAGAGSELLVGAGSSEIEPIVALFDATGRRLAAGPFVRLRLDAAGTYFVGVTTADDPDFEGARDQGPYVLFSPLLFTPRVLLPGHPFEFATPLPFGWAIAADPDTGVVYGLDGNLFDPHWRLVRVAGGRGDVVSEILAPEVPPLGRINLSVFSDLEFAGGFGGADLLATDTLGRTVALGAAGGPQRPFADTRGGLFTGLALSPDRLFVSSGLAGPSEAIYVVDETGSVSTFMAPPTLSSPPHSLALSPDGRAVYYASLFDGDLVQVDVRSAAEVGRVRAGPPFSLSSIAVDPATGDVYARVVDLMGLLAGPGTVSIASAIVRYDRATGEVGPFADGLPLGLDLAFGPCAEDRSLQEWCLFATTDLGLIKIHGFEPPFVRDLVGDAPPALDVRRADVRYVDLLGSGSSTHLEVSLRLAAAPHDGEFHVLLDYGETPELGADVDLTLGLAGGAATWSGLGGLGERSTVEGDAIRFLAPIEELRRAASDEQKAAAAENIRLWVGTGPGGATDRAPDRGAFRFGSFYPRLVFGPPALEFGSVKPGERVVREITVSNAGVGPLPVTNMQVSGPAFSLVGAVPESIAEGGRARVAVACEPDRDALFEGKLHLRSQDPIGDRQAQLRCRGRSTVTTRTGQFVGYAGHHASGTATLELQGDGSLLLTFGADFLSSGVPGPYVILSDTILGASTSGGYIVGPLQSIAGSQSYTITDPGVSIDTYDFVLVYDLPFKVTVGYALLD